MSPVAVTVLPVWASILLALAAPGVAAVAVVVGKRTQDATLKQQSKQFDATLTQQREQLAATLKQQGEQLGQERAQHEQMLRHERQRDDLSEVRSCLDDAARALNEADRCHRDVYDDLGDLNKAEALRDAGRRLDEVKQRLAIRFGSDHEVTTDMGTCADLSLEVYAATDHWRLDDRDHAREQAKRATEEFRAPQRHFISAAIRYAGVDLPAQTTTA